MRRVSSLATNPHVWYKLIVFRPLICLVAPLISEGLSIYSTNLYQGVNIFIFGDQSIAGIVRAGGRLTDYCPLDMLGSQ